MNKQTLMCSLRTLVVLALATAFAVPAALACTSPPPPPQEDPQCHYRAVAAWDLPQFAAYQLDGPTSLSLGFKIMLQPFCIKGWTGTSSVPIEPTLLDEESDPLQYRITAQLQCIDEAGNSQRVYTQQMFTWQTADNWDFEKYGWYGQGEDETDQVTFQLDSTVFDGSPVSCILRAVHKESYGLML